MQKEESQRLLELRRLELEAETKIIELGSKHHADGTGPRPSYATQRPKIPPLNDLSQLDLYLERFERHTSAFGCHETEWAPCLSNLLQDEALSIFLSLSPEEGADYQAVKRVLLQRFGCDRNGFRSKFLSVKPQDAEDFETFINRAKRYFDRWVELSGVTTLEGLAYLICSEIALQACDEDFVAYVKDRSPSDMVSLKTVASAYIDARANKSFRRKHSVSFSAKSEPYRPSIRVVEKRDNRGNWPMSQRGVSASSCPSRGPDHPVFRVQVETVRLARRLETRTVLILSASALARVINFDLVRAVVPVWQPVTMTSYFFSAMERDIFAVRAVRERLILPIRHQNCRLIVVLPGLVLILELLVCLSVLRMDFLNGFTLSEFATIQTTIAVPESLRQIVLSYAHESDLAGHSGFRKTLSAIRNYFSWPGVCSDVKKYTTSCHLCQIKPRTGRNRPAPFQPVPIVGERFERVIIDLVGPLPLSSDRYEYLLTLVDVSTRWAEAVLLRRITAKDVAEALFAIFVRLGFPKEIQSDHGQQFMSNLLAEFNNLCNIKHFVSTPYHPQTNGIVERFHSTLKSMIRKLSHESPTEWNRFVPAALFAYRVPVKKKEVRSFLGFVNYYRHFITNFASISAPLSDLLPIETLEKVQWTPRCDQSLAEIKKLFLSPPILIIPDMQETFIVRSDASDFGIGAVLLQDHEGILMPCHYASRKLLLRETRYSAIEREALALVFTVTQFQRYLIFKHFILQTDHKRLSYLRTGSPKNARLMRWALALQEFSFQVVHIPGSENIHADVLSRLC
ncbi:Pol polyprotein [Plakobranchus ocellatus]|uniref:Pol polyprotein n=1 Tax=Plakobranchus ocellatus TaxID=259542 RepID=A0AAV3YAQ8_9GAST|nr:Pol polyprotein [Plakobranchus ocellatus]